MKPGRIYARPTPTEVREAMRFYAEHGHYQLGTPEAVKEVAEWLRTAAEAVSESVGEGK